jgi:glycosyltransferase involved in cell wall biosynthesis
MRILFISHYFSPEGNAPATRVFEMTRRWAAAGHSVTVITGVPNVPNGVPYPGYRNRIFRRETMEHVEVQRVWTFLAPNRGTVRRILNYLSFMVSAITAGLFVPRPDVVIATSPQFFCGWAGAWVARLRRRPFILEIRDLWPESIAAVGAIRRPAILRFLGWLEKRLYAAARVLVTVGEGYREQLEARGVPPARLRVVPNGVNLRMFSPQPRDERRRAELGFRPGDFVCAYVGTLGMACGLDIVIRAARTLQARGRTDICFLLVGDGAVREALEKEARTARLERVLITGRLEKEKIPGILAASDACLIHLKRQLLFRSVLPSKIFEAAAMARPIILGVEGHAAALVQSAGAGLCIEPDNDEALVHAVEQLAADAEQREKMGQAGREKIGRRFDYDLLASEYLRILEQQSSTAGA